MIFISYSDIFFEKKGSCDIFYFYFDRKIVSHVCISGKDKVRSQFELK